MRADCDNRPVPGRNDQRRVQHDAVITATAAVVATRTRGWLLDAMWRHDVRRAVCDSMRRFGLLRMRMRRVLYCCTREHARRYVLGGSGME